MRRADGLGLTAWPVLVAPAISDPQSIVARSSAGAELRAAILKRRSARMYRTRRWHHNWPELFGAGWPARRRLVAPVPIGGYGARRCRPPPRRIRSGAPSRQVAGPGSRRCAKGLLAV